MDFLPSKNFLYTLGGVLFLALFFVAVSRWGLGSLSSPPTIALSPSGSLTPKIYDTGFASSTALENATLSYASGGNLTAGVAEKMISSFNDFKQHNGTVTPEQIQQITHSVADPINSEADAPHYALTDIRSTMNDHTSETYLHLYTDYYILVMAHFSDVYRTDLLQLYLDVAQKGDASKLPILASRAQEFRDYADMLQKVVAPKKIWQDQYNLMNSSWALGQDIDNLRIGFETNDPIRSLIGLNAYMKHLETRQEAEVAITRYLKAQNISFKPDEAGAYLAKINL